MLQESIVEQERDKSDILNARTAFEAGFLYDEEYVMILNVFKDDRASVKQQEWIDTIASRIEANLTVQLPQSLKDRSLRSLTVIDARGNARQLTSFDPCSVMAAENLVETKSALGKRRVRSSNAMRRSA